MKLLLKHPMILTEDWSVISDGFLGIDGDSICYVGKERPQEDYDAEKDMSRRLLIPGLYNLHTHTPMSLLRGLGSDLPLDRWLNEAMFPVEARLCEADVAVGTRLSLMEMLACGTVSFTDMYDRTWTTMEEVLHCGIKANLTRPLMSMDPNEAYEDSVRAKESFQLIKDIAALKTDRIKGDFSIHAEYTNRTDIVARYAEDCRRMGGRIHIHLSETKKEQEECKLRHGKTPARWFYDLGVMELPVIAAHCIWLEEEDFPLLKEKNVSCVHNPTSNMKLGSGFMPVQRLLDEGIRVCLGTDGSASNNNQNLFEEIHLASVIHNGYTNDPTIMKPTEVLTMVTKNGAEAQGRQGCGRLAPGCKADIVAIDLDRPHLMPLHQLPALLTYAVSSSDVVMTMVDGNILYENGQFLTMDWEKTKFELDAAMKRLF